MILSKYVSYVSGLRGTTSDYELRGLFEVYDTVVRAHVVRHKYIVGNRTAMDSWTESLTGKRCVRSSLWKRAI
ncbi:MAG: hypothetical protein OJF50_002731 [Nitrospira sp.]|jgi:hypothetical protein|nr:hypothetical protein [Nitrospira sp.]